MIKTAVKYGAGAHTEAHAGSDRDRERQVFLKLRYKATKVVGMDGRPNMWFHGSALHEMSRCRLIEHKFRHVRMQG